MKKTKNKNILTPQLNFQGKENIKSQKRLALVHHKKIKGSDAIYIYDPDGFIGKGTNLEIGYALSLNKKIFALEKVGDIGIDCFIEKFLTLEQLKKTK